MPSLTPSPIVSAGSVTPHSATTLHIGRNVKRRLGNMENKDIITTLFPQKSPVDNCVEEIFTIAYGPSQSQAFIYQQTIFVTLVASRTDLRSWTTNLIELAEEQFNCLQLVVILDKSNLTLVRPFLYIGFQLIDPKVYNHDPDYILLGYDLC